MSWYKQSMPTVKQLSPIVSQICSEIAKIPGVHGVHLYGSYASHLNQPNYVVKDVDIIASTSFDSGDLLAIDNSKYSALRIDPRSLEDEGFHPEAVAFTKKFLSYEKHNVDHWAASSDGKLLHWGAIPDTTEEWADLHAKAEKEALRQTGLKREQLTKSCEEKRKDWKMAYDRTIAKHLESGATGWYPSDHPVDEILAKAIKI